MIVLLKVASATFLLIRFLSLKQSPCETMKYAFYFTSKALFVLKKTQGLEFYIFKFHGVIKCLSIKKKYIFLNNLGSKHSLLMEFDQFILYYKRKSFKIYY